jgi:hypothetical protein
MVPEGRHRGVAGRQGQQSRGPIHILDDRDLRLCAAETGAGVDDFRLRSGGKEGCKGDAEWDENRFLLHKSGTLVVPN